MSAGEASTDGSIPARRLMLAAMTIASSMILVDQTAVPLATPDVIEGLGGRPPDRTSADRRLGVPTALVSGPRTELQLTHEPLFVHPANPGALAPTGPGPRGYHALSRRHGKRRRRAVCERMRQDSSDKREPA